MARPAGVSTADATTLPAQPPVLLRLLGPFELLVRGAPLARGLRSTAREVLAYLAMHPDGATPEELVCALWPEEPPEPGNRPLHTALVNARHVLRQATALGKDADFISRTSTRYQLNPALITTDLAQWHTAVHESEAARKERKGGKERKGTEEEYAALAKAAEIVRGIPLDDVDSEWAESSKRQLCREFIDILSRAARLAPEMAEEISHLEKARTIDPYDENIYRDLMHTYARAGQPEAAARTFHLLRDRLAELDTTPTPQTEHLAARLTTPGASRVE
jgi:DNA-binding SARP family transcriptional activator